MTHSHALPPGLGPITSLTHTHGGSTHTHVSAPEPGGPAPRLHLRGVVLPDDEVRDVWIHDGVLSFEPVADALTVATGVWILPGLVDAHCHVGLESHGGVDEARAQEHAEADRDAGTLLIRDAGSPVDTRWMDERDDLPRIIRAARHIARPKRYSRNFAEEVEPEDLVAAIRVQARRGDGWVKLVGDWIDRDAGDLTPSWPADVARAAIAAAQAEGARGDTIESAHRVLGETIGPVAAAMLGAGLLASGLGSALVGTHAGARIARDALPLSMTPTMRRALTLVPALVLLVVGAPPTLVLVVSQIVLSFGIVFAAAPLLWLTGSREVMGRYADSGAGKIAGWVIVGLIVALNVSLLVSLVP